MNILILNSERGWRGGEAQTLLLAEGLREKGHTVTIGCPEQSALATRAQQAQIDTYAVAMKGSIAIGSVWRLCAWITKNAPDIIHVQTAHALSAAALALMGQKIPLVVSRRVNFPLSGSGFTRWKYGRAQAITAISRAVKKTLEKGGIPGDKISILPDGVVLPATVTHNPQPLCAEMQLHAMDKIVLCIANLSAEKDHETLLRAWKKVRDQTTSAQLIIVGDGEQRAHLEALATTLELTACHFIGFRTDIAALLQAAHVVVLTSREEGLGSILLEAQANGVPIVATNAGGIPEAVIDQQTGFVVPVGDASAFSAALTQLLSDRELHQRFSTAARLHIEQHFSASIIIDAHMTLYEQLLSTGTHS